MRLKIFSIDDDASDLHLLSAALPEIVPTADHQAFSCAKDAIESIQAEWMPNVAFLDIKMPEMTGLEVARRIKQISNDIKIVFVTHHAQYAAEAFAIRANGYLIKPICAEKIRAELEYLSLLPFKNSSKEDFRVQCFGNFEAFYRGNPIHFQYSKTKELLAYLVDRKGALCTNGELMAVLWEDRADAKHKYSYLNNLRADLYNTLKKLNCEQVVVRQRGRIAVAAEQIQCDYYDWLGGKNLTEDNYRGEYMAQYSWGRTHAGQSQIKKLT